MGFEKDNKVGVQFSKDHQPESNGRPLGSKSRSTIAKKVLEMTGVLPDEMFDALKAIFPDIDKKMSFEEIGNIAIAANMVKGDVASYKAIMDSAYGAPKQEVEHSGSIKIGKDLADEDYK